MSSWGKKLFERGKNRVIFKSSKREKKRNLSYTGIKIYQLGFRRVILSTSFLPPTLPEKFFTPPIVRNIPEEGRTTFEFEFRKLELFEITLYNLPHVYYSHPITSFFTPGPFHFQKFFTPS